MACTVTVTAKASTWLVPEDHVDEYWNADGTGHLYSEDAGPDTHGGGVISMSLNIVRVDEEEEDSEEGDSDYPE